MQPINRRIVKFIQAHHVATVATSANNCPWVAHCFYVFLKEEQVIVFTTDADTRHGKEMDDNHKVAIGIALETKRVGKIRGVQIEGTAKYLDPKSPDPVQQELFQKAKKTYLKRYPYAVLMKTTLRAVQPESIKLTDNRLGFGKKLLWPPPKPPKPPNPPKPSKPSKPSPKPSPKPSFKNIIFDLGGVLMQIDFTLTFHAFEQLVAQNPEHSEKRKFSAQLLFQDPGVKQILEDFETGKITERAFRTRMMAASGLTVSDEEFDAAWNALLMYYPEDYIPLVQQLRKNYRVFLLSNTNSIHRRYFNHKLKEQFGIESMDHLMDQAFYSFELGFRKPDPRIYQKMQEQTGISFEETLFLDDLEDNIISARQAGMQTVWINDTKTITDVFITG